MFLISPAMVHTAFAQVHVDRPPTSPSHATPPSFPPPLKVSIVAMSGAVGEAMSYGTATGGATDLDNLGQIMNQTNPPMDGKEQQSQARQEQEDEEIGSGLLFFFCVPSFFVFVTAVVGRDGSSTSPAVASDASKQGTARSAFLPS